MSQLDIWSSIMKILMYQMRIKIDWVFMASCWVISIERNKRMFSGEALS